MGCDLQESKFRDPELLRRAKENSPEHVTAIVEVLLPSRNIEFKDGQRYGIPLRVPGSITRQSADEEEEISQTINDTRESLRQIVGSEPRWLGSSRVFILEASGSDLTAIAGLPTVKAIHPNRNLK